MKKKFEKIIFVIKKDGILVTIKKTFKYIKAKYLSKINIFSYINVKLNKRKYKNLLDNIFLNNNFDRIIIWKSDFGWNVPLFQRPQHISINLARKRCLVLYEVTTMTDNVKQIKKVEDNLFLVNFNNRAIKKMILEKVRNINLPRYIQIYSTDYNMTISELKQYLNDGYKIIYEYIDDLSPLIIGTKELPINIKEKYEYMLNDKENVFVIVTADEIQKDVISKRGTEKLAFACNGVDYNHFNILNKDFSYDKKFLDIVNEKKPIIGYYGALASWFDYEMVKYLAKKRPEYNIVLLGVKYDDSFEKSNLGGCTNVYFLGSKKYEELPNYANYFNVCTIPFLINEITQSTSPLKLFEYMAMGKPIVTTAMNECKKYESVMIAKNNDEFVELVDKAITLSSKENKEYFELLNKEALENTWEAKAKVIINLLKENEK